MRREEVPSTQDLARHEIGRSPVLVIAAGQTAGRGRSGSHWETAPRAVAASLATRSESPPERPLSLIAGVAACRVIGPQARLKWPNDVIMRGSKVGGVLVEASHGVTVIGMGLNLWWPDAPFGAGAIVDEDPGPDRHGELGALWGAELMRFLDDEGWPRDEYTDLCSTLGREIVWEPDGSGVAVGIAESGGLIVEQDGHTRELYSGSVAHVRAG